MKWKNLIRNSAALLSMNQRNLLYVYPYNRRKHFPLADDKLLTKKALMSAGVSMPATYKVYGNFYELAGLEDDLIERPEFVIKPAQGKGGGGIIAIAGYGDGSWQSISGKKHSPSALKKHIADIIFGVYSFDLYDRAIIEERVLQHPELERLSPFGLADIRLILFSGKPVLAMARIPTRKSEGRANLHQGAVGIGLDSGSGAATNAAFKGQRIDAHPDTGMPLIDYRVPFWNEVLEMGQRTANALPLKYLGVDIAISEHGPTLLEVNVRPGLEIQIANMTGMRRILESIENREPGEG